MKHRVFCVASLLFVFGLTGCTNSSVQTETVIVPIPADFRVVLGQGGGFAGLWSGYTILADGSVQAWSGPVQNENPEVIGMLPGDRMRALWRQILEADYFNQDSQETGNMTAFMEITADSTVHRTSWIPIVEGIEEPTTPLEILYVSVSALAREAGDKYPRPL